MPALVIMRRYLGCFRPHPAPASETGSSPGSVIVHPDSVSVHHAPGAEARLDALESAVRSLERQAVVRPAYRYVVVLTAPWREFGEWEEPEICIADAAHRGPPRPALVPGARLPQGA